MKRFDQVNMIPFIDIMLVLLAIVLTTASFISQGALEIKLPVAESAAALKQSDTKVIEIAVNAEKEYLLDGEPSTQQAIETTLEGLDKSTPILLRFDKSVEIEQFVGVIDLLKKNKLEKFTIITKSNL